MGNLDLYNRVRSVPEKATKAIAAGRLKGMTDINPMWRIKTLTDEFGICGFGWYTEFVRTWIEDGANGERTANVEIRLFVKLGNEWSRGIPGIGGSSLIAKETKGLYTDDECYKKAYTDALSVACKALGIGADVYFAADRTKYDRAPAEGSQKPVDGTQGAVGHSPAPASKRPARITEEALTRAGVGDAAAAIRYFENKIGTTVTLFSDEALEWAWEVVKKQVSKHGGAYGQV